MNDNIDRALDLSILRATIDEVGRPVRLGNCSKSVGIKTWGEVVWFGDALLAIPGLGRRSLNDAKDITAAHWPEWYGVWGYGGRDALMVIHHRVSVPADEDEF